MSKGFNMLREYIENDALCMRRGKCCDFEYELQKEFAALESENASLMGAAQGLGELCDQYKAENAKLRDFIELLLSCPRDSGECKECRRLNDLCAVELEAGKLGIEVE